MKIPGTPVTVTVTPSPGLYGRSVMSVEVTFSDGSSVRFRDPPWSSPASFVTDPAPGLYCGGRERGSAALVSTDAGATAALLSAGVERNNGA